MIHVKKALDIGCGQGFNTYVLAKKYDAIGVDLSEENIEVAKARYKTAEFRRMNAEELEFADGEFDYVYAIDVLEHVDNLGPVIREVYRVLGTGGKFIVNVPAEKSENWLSKIRPKYFEEIHHVRIFRDDELERVLTRAGFVMTKQQAKGCLQHLELYYLFTRKNPTSTQLGVGTWRDSTISKIVHVSLLYFDPTILHTPLKYFPLYVFSLPIGYIVNYFGNKMFPKSFYHEFVKA